MLSRIFLSFVAVLLVASTPAVAEDATEAAEFDPELAAELEADKFGMRRYVMAFLKSGPNRPEDPEKAQALQRAHLENIRRMAEEGKLVLAGPFMDRGEIRGIYVFAVDSVEEAEALTATDPAVQAGSLVMELHPWYGSAALMKVNDIHARVAKASP
ncbi:MAG TPA: YciI family protein [Wenzhouxiangellaceae bacterium]|nr:YciI family protein [Wenzhouxiangellaceae bacterium]HKL53248.1 YciI family protein [Wenzhouxiangellaceae bacterium]